MFVGLDWVSARGLADFLLSTIALEITVMHALPQQPAFNTNGFLKPYNTNRFTLKFVFSIVAANLRMRAQFF
jgi:hypothetical protein|tara:strand:- start:274 stop:489 length:216 start_codon:yes stop_codon:yes gene_type:complete